MLRESYSIGGYDGSASGATLNGGGGFVFRAGPQVNIDVGMTYGFTKFGDTKVKSGATGETFQVTSGSGSNIVLRLGAAVGLIR